MAHDRRSILATIGLVLPFGIDTRCASAAPTGPAPVLGLRPFEESVREAFAAGSRAPVVSGEFDCRRIEIGHSEEVLAGVQGCHNDRPFAGFPAGHLRIVRLGFGPGPVVHGVRLHVATVDVALTRGRDAVIPSRALDFGVLPPAPVLVPRSAVSDEPAASRPRDARSTGHKIGRHSHPAC